MMRALPRLCCIALLATALGSCSDAARVLTSPAELSFARLANPTVSQTLIAEINAAITCAYAQDPKLLSRKLREFEQIVALNTRSVAQAEAVRAHVNNFIRDSKRAVNGLTTACDGKSPAVAAQELYNALYLLSDQPQNVETPEYVGDAEVAVFIPGEELEVRSEDAVVIVPADAYNIPVIISLREITEPTFDPTPFAAVGTPIVPAYEFSVQPNIAAGGDGVGRYICVALEETQTGFLQLFRDTGNGIQGITNDNNGGICHPEDQISQISNPLLRGMARFASGITKPFRPTLLYALQHAAIGGPDIFFSPHMVVRLFGSGFEDSEPVVWSPTGLGQPSTAASFSNTAFPTHVTTLDAVGQPGGSLPGPFAGDRSAWFGQPSTGNYIGTQAAGDFPGSGGTSIAANSGALESPAFTVPNVRESVELRFKTWWEIESVNPSGFDVMDVVVHNVATTAETVVRRLNPASDPTSPLDRAALPYTSGGFNTAPVWQDVAIDLSAYKGQSIRLRFVFATFDGLYNGFRGWLIDDVVLATVPAPPVLFSRSSTSGAAPLVPADRMAPPPRR